MTFIGTTQSSKILHWKISLSKGAICTALDIRQHIGSAK
jgi:hypothetical protein